MIERVVQDEGRGEAPAARNRKAAAWRGHCGREEDGGLETRTAKRRKRPSAASRNRIWNCPQITFTTYYVAGIEADMKTRNSPSASICVICGQMLFLLPAAGWKRE